MVTWLLPLWPEIAPIPEYEEKATPFKCPMSGKEVVFDSYSAYLRYLDGLIRDAEKG